MKYTAHIDRLTTFVQHGQPKDYGGSHMMCSDVALLLHQVSTARGCNPEEVGAPGHGPAPAAGNFVKDAERYRLIRSALLSGGPEWAKLAAMLNIAPDTAQGVDDAVDATFSMGGE